MIPSGEVTFLFTDIVGSTKVAQKFPGVYQTALRKHDSILKKTIESNRGFIFKTVGDSIYASFANVEDAVESAV